MNIYVDGSVCIYYKYMRMCACLSACTDPGTDVFDMFVYNITGTEELKMYMSAKHMLKC